MQEDSPKSSESNTEARINSVTQLLKEKGPDDPEARALLIELIQSMENTADANVMGHGRIGLDRLRASIYLRAGYKEEAIESLQTALMQASGEGDPDLWDAIIIQIEEFKK